MQRPFFKWPGSKVWLLEKIAPYLAEADSLRIVEPFSGSAAFFLGMASSRALLADTNQYVAAALRAVRDDPRKVLWYLKRFRNTKEIYDRVRAQSPGNEFAAAARLIFLTNTSWGGLYRENKLGQFNVPFGDNKREFYSEELIFLASAKLKNAEIIQSGYEATLTKVANGDMLFVDSPYVTSKAERHFDRYHASRFSWDDQKLLANLLRSKRLRHLPTIVTCAADSEMYALFKGWTVIEFQKRNSMTAKDKLGYRREALLLNPPLKRVGEQIVADQVGSKVDLI